MQKRPKMMKNHAKTARDGPETSPDTSESAEKVYTEQLHHGGQLPRGPATCALRRNMNGEFRFLHPGLLVAF